MCRYGYEQGSIRRSIHVMETGLHIFVRAGHGRPCLGGAWRRSRKLELDVGRPGIPLLPGARAKYANCGSIFDSARLKRELAVVEEKIADPAVWADAARSQPLMRERKAAGDAGGG